MYVCGPDMWKNLSCSHLMLPWWSSSLPEPCVKTCTSEDTVVQASVAMDKTSRILCLLRCRLLIHRNIAYNTYSETQYIFFTWILFLKIISNWLFENVITELTVIWSFFPFYMFIQVAHLHLILWLVFHHTATSATQIKLITDILLTRYVSDKRLNDLCKRIDMFWSIFCVKNRFGPVVNF